MNLSLRSAYESFLYSLAESYCEQVASSTLHLFSVSSHATIVRGSVYLLNGLELRVYEAIDFDHHSFLEYSYTVLYRGERVRWYDAQPHAEIPELTGTFPHHRHEAPDIKHNRHPAPGISFAESNLPTLINDCIELGRQLTDEDSSPK
jgi:hypothetical protein